MRYLDNIVWELTLRCNAKCSHCGSAAGVDRSDNLTNDEIMRICDELAEVGCRKVNLIGGEMFLHPLWREIIQKLHSLNIEVAIITNAISLNPKKIEFLAQNKLNILGISLDGATKETHDGIRGVKGTFDHIFSLSEDIKQSKIPTVAITTVTKRNILELPALMTMLPASFFDGWQLQIGTPFGRLAEDNTTLNELEYYIVGIYVALIQIRNPDFVISGMHDFGYYSDVIPNHVNNFKQDWQGCPAGRHVMGIRSNGKVVGCLSIYNDDYLETMDLRTKSVKEIWESKDFCRWNTIFNRYKNLQGFCKTCEYASACCAGCSGTAVAYYGNANQNKMCYHKIEQEYKNYSKDDEYGNLLKMLVNGRITDDGRFISATGEALSDSILTKLNDSYLRNLLRILL